MNRPASPDRPIPLHDYSSALKNAVSWLGERYLLADPVPRLKDESKDFFSTPRSWHAQLARL